MKAFHFFLALAAALGSATAQDLSQLPACAQSCATNSIPSSCNMMDIKCICSAGSFLTDISCCIANKCSPSDQEKTIKFAEQICSGAGVTNLPTAASCANTATAAASKTSAASAATETSNASVTSSETTVASVITSSATHSATTNAAVPVVRNNDAAFLIAAGAAAAFVMFE